MLTQEQLQDIRHAVNYYRMHCVSLKNPRYEEYSFIVDELSKLITEKDK